MIRVLQESLSITVHERPYLAGQVVSRESTHHSTNNDRPGELPLKESSDKAPDIRIRVNDTTQPGHGWEHSYVELRDAGMPVSKLDGAFLAPLSGYNTNTNTKVMAAQANLIDGGCLLSVYFLHSFVDAFGASLVMGAWAENCRKLQENFASPSPPLVLAGAESTSASLTRLTVPKTLQLPSILEKTASSLTSRQEEYERLKKRPELWKVLGLDWRPLQKNSAPPFPNTSLISTSVFSATPTTLSKLKRDASPASEPSETPNGQRTASWISTRRSRIYSGRRIYLVHCNTELQ